MEDIPLAAARIASPAPRSNVEVPSASISASAVQDDEGLPPLEDAPVAPVVVWDSEEEEEEEDVDDEIARLQVRACRDVKTRAELSCDGPPLSPLL